MGNNERARAGRLQWDLALDAVCQSPRGAKEFQVGPGSGFIDHNDDCFVDVIARL